MRCHWVKRKTNSAECASCLFSGISTLLILYKYFDLYPTKKKIKDSDRKSVPVSRSLMDKRVCKCVCSICTYFDREGVLNIFATLRLGDYLNFIPHTFAESAFISLLGSLFIVSTVSVLRISSDF